ncbi:DMT family transporter [Lactobacillus corticis]|uniref:Small multidrug resistance protein n=1 Tax=Lactobacillus corticis TaxID=2201249 RepID=A0A916VIP9_9LACO|nr:multidrug efflux SMR transporter [Lactobacillus corticis]GFZ27538.1 small multidrug resistance protein [Lactobacillus corticis]
MGYLQLFIAIVCEIVATNALKASHSFTRLGPSLLTIIFYAICYYAFAQSLKTVNLSVAYATWGGLGIVLTTIIAIFFWGEKINLPEGIGIMLIVIGVVVCNYFAK